MLVAVTQAPRKSTLCVVRPAFLLLLFLGSACTDDTRRTALLQPCGQGVIEIRSLSPARPGPLGIEFASVEHDREFSLETHTDSTGVLVQDVPYGLYRLLVRTDGGDIGHYYYVSHGRAAGYGEAETLAVGFPQDHLRIDLALGALEIRLRTPPSLEGQEVSGTACLTDAHAPACYRAATRCQGDTAVLFFPATVSGQYRVEAGVWPNSSWMPFGSTEQTGQLLSVEPGMRTVHEFSLPPAAVLRGDLRGAHQAVSHLFWESSSITAVTPDSTQAGLAYIPKDGAWTMTVIPSGPVRLRLVSGGLARWIGGADFASATVFTAIAGETLQVPEERESAIVLRLEEPGGELDPGPLIEVHDAGGTLLGQVGRRCTSCQEGNRFAVGNLLGGSYYLRLRPGIPDLKGTWSPMWLDQALTMAEATPVRVSFAGEIVPVTVRLWPAAVIRGRLRTEQPVYYNSLQTGITVASDTIGTLASRYLDEPTESFAFSGMEPGSYLLFATVRRSGDWRRWRWWCPGTWSAAQAQPVLVDAPGQEQNVEWSLPQ
jgi:hypothetical protein